MKALVIFVSVIGFAQAASLEINAFDQEKLAHLLNKLPTSVVDRSFFRIPEGRRIKNTLKHKTGAYEIRCVSDYLDDSPYPSTPSCEVELDEKSQDVDKAYDEWRIEENRKALASAIFNATSYGPANERIFRSANSEMGTDFNGRRTHIFRYYFSCTKEKCLFRFSEKAIK